MNTTVPQGESFFLICLVTGYPQPTVTWVKNGIEFDPMYFVGVSFSNEDGKLRFAQATEDFLGEYVCEARNDRGTVISDPASVTLLCE